MAGAVVPFVYIFLQQDYNGKNKFRIDRVRAEFGEKLTPVFRFGSLRMKSVPGREPDERDGLGVAKILWADDEKIRKDIAVPFFQMLDSSGKPRFVIAPGQVDGRDCIISLRVTGSRFGVPTKEFSQVFLLGEKAK
jgi:hypothetical protein